MSAPCLLLVHGWGCDATIWDGLRAALDGFETLAVERGYLGACPALADGAGRRDRGRPFGRAARPPGGPAARLLPAWWRSTASPASRRLPTSRPGRRDACWSAWRAGWRSIPTDAAGVPRPLRPAAAARPLVRAGRHGMTACATGWPAWRRRTAARRRKRLRLLALAADGRPDRHPSHDPRLLRRGRHRWHPGDSHVLPLADPSWCAGQLRRFAS